jgi:2-polyprenyl-3-methyl-5-hydroxy-6-metoxy-1,4-benzoquinol methylase
MTETDSAAPRYDFSAIDLDSDSVHADVVRLIGESRRVLELGPATGYMSHVLRDRGCAIVGIELDAAMAERAAEFCERVIVGDIDVLDLDAELGEDRFDAIVAADVLEHLKDPLAALERLRPFLTPDGCFVISVPNVAHGSVRLALLSGKFPYQEIGLLDRTHLRFFTRESLEQLLDTAELGVAELHRHELNIDASEVPFNDADVPAELRAMLDQDLEARTYQFVVKAVPMARAGLREIQQQLRELVAARAELDELRKAAARAAELEATIAALSGREGELRRGLIDAHDQLLRRDAQLERLNEEVERYEETAQRRDAEIEGLQSRLGASEHSEQRLRVRLDRILQSPPGRAYAALRALPGVRGVARRRKAGFDAEVAKRTGQSS